MSERNGTPAIDRSEAVKAIASGADMDDTADVAGVDRETIREWAYRDPEFMASVNRTKRERADQLRAEVLSLASDSVGVIREMIRSDDVPPAVRLKACCIILAAADALKPIPIGSTRADGIRRQLSHRELLESLGG
jgi:hypothetical protein